MCCGETAVSELMYTTKTNCVFHSATHAIFLQGSPAVKTSEVCKQFSHGNALLILFSS